MYTWRGPRRKLSAEETARNAQHRAERTAAAMHCQCCGRLILANTGTIAHHGYSRPGSGWQTASCMGAKYLPFETSRDQLGVMIKVIEQMIADHEDHIHRISTEISPVRFTWTVNKIDETGRCLKDRRGRRLTETRHFDITRDIFGSDQLPEDVAQAIRAAYLHSYDDIMERDLRPVRYRLKSLQGDLKGQQARFDGWKQTHEWWNKEWRIL
jgi:hypothetical protein